MFRTVWTLKLTDIIITTTTRSLNHEVNIFELKQRTLNFLVDANTNLIKIILLYRKTKIIDNVDILILCWTCMCDKIKIIVKDTFLQWMYEYN